jgi:RNA polymerase sigma-B factor
MKATAQRLFDELPQSDLLLSRAIGELTQRQGRAPTPSELAAHLEIGRDEVLAGLEAGYACHTTSLDHTVSTGSALGDLLGEEDAELTKVDNRETLLPLLRGLSERDRLILELRFVHEMTQSQIAERIGVCQVHVSRLLTRILARLREGLGAA